MRRSPPRLTCILSIEQVAHDRRSESATYGWATGRSLRKQTYMFRCAQFFAATLVALTAGCNQSGADLPAPPPAVRTDPPPPPGASDISYRTFSLPLSAADAEQILLLTEIFQFSGPSRQVQAYNAVFDQPDATARFRSLAARARWAGRLYALCALTILEPAEAEQLGQRLSPVDERTLAYHGDVGGERRVSELVNVVRERTLAETFRNLKEVPVQIALQGQAVFASSAGHNVISDSPVTVYIPAAYPRQEVWGTFVSDTLIVAFTGSTAAGGVRIGSLVIEDTPGELARGIPGWRDGCVARLRRAGNSAARFRVRFTITTDQAAACSNDSGRK